MMSHVLTKLNGVFRLSRALRFSYKSGRSNGGLFFISFARE